MKNKTKISFFTGVLLCSIILFISYDGVKKEMGIGLFILVSIAVIAIHVSLSHLLLLQLDKLWIAFVYNLSFLISAFVLDEFGYFYPYFYLIFFLLRILFGWNRSEPNSFEVLDD